MVVDIALPYRTDWREMTSVLDYCKGKGADRTALEARFGVGESLRETLNALEQLGLIVRGETGDVRLTVRGEQLAYAPDATRLRARLIDALLGYAPYRFPLERAVADDSDLLDSAWVEHIWQVDMRLGQPRNRVEEARTLFFRLADEAGLGTYRRGVRGQTTRLELADDFRDTLRPLLRRDDAAVSGSPEVVTPAPGGPRIPNHATDRLAGDNPASAAGVERDALVPTVPLSRGTPTSSTGVPRPGLAPQQVHVADVGGLSIHVDMSDWELDKIEGFLRLIGYLPR